MTRHAEQQIVQLITPSLEGMGYTLVRVLLDGAHPQRLQVMIDKADETPVTIEDCTEVSHMVSALLDVEDPIAGTYNLEVSTPGIDRPLTRLRDFERFAGLMARVEMQTDYEDQHPVKARLKGRIKGVDGQSILMTLDGQEKDVISLPFDAMLRAKLVMNDELIAFSADQLKANGKITD